MSWPTTGSTEFVTPNNQLTSLNLFRQMTFQPIQAESHQAHQSMPPYTPFQRYPKRNDSDIEIEQMKRDILLTESFDSQVQKEESPRMTPNENAGELDKIFEQQIQNQNNINGYMFESVETIAYSAVNEGMIISSNNGSIPSTQSIEKPIKPKCVDSETQTNQQKSYFDPRTLGPSKHMSYSKIVEKLKCHYQVSSKNLFNSILNKNYQPHRATTQTRVLQDITKDPSLHSTSKSNKSPHNSYKQQRQEIQKQFPTINKMQSEKQSDKALEYLEPKIKQEQTNYLIKSNKSSTLTHERTNEKSTINANLHDQIESKQQPVQISLSVSRFKKTNMDGKQYDIQSNSQYS